VLVTDIDLGRTEAVRRIWPFLRDRRIDAYAGLSERYLDRERKSDGWFTGANFPIKPELIAEETTFDATNPGLSACARRTRLEQLADVLAEMSLPVREPRCMDCSGTLEGVAKDSVRDRIPPRTALWKDEYFLCGWCGKLYWRGTHWERIAARLRPLTEQDAAK